ncbi:hypothetical protein IHE44_0007114 [Lamprotornis superbus]|uniref:Uncharacterized protein n=1 Tax=Lamprotornis superbus TaxID=245042 RepID=A0A835NT83_9PASS|nr:hypothetical protein IHE44_0007114 [Lamprotornis superbus]
MSQRWLKKDVLGKSIVSKILILPDNSPIWGKVIWEGEGFFWDAKTKGNYLRVKREVEALLISTPVLHPSPHFLQHHPCCRASFCLFHTSTSLNLEPGRLWGDESCSFLDPTPWETGKTTMSKVPFSELSWTKSSYPNLVWLSLPTGLWIHGCNGHSAFTRELGSADVKGLTCPDVQDSLTSAVEGIVVSIWEAANVSKGQCGTSTHQGASALCAAEVMYGFMRSQHWALECIQHREKKEKTGIQFSQATGSWRNRSPGLKSNEAREGLRHTGAAGQDNLPSVLSGFTPVLPVTPERRITETPLIYCGEGSQGRGTNHLWSIAHRQGSRWVPDLPFLLILLNPS